MNRIAFLCDSSADISPEQAEELNIHVLRMPIILDGKEYIEAETIQDFEIMEAQTKGYSIKTAQPIVGDLLKMWDDLLKDHDQILYLPLSRELSGTCQTALQASQMELYQGRVVVIDSRYVAYPIVYLLKEARQMVDKGLDLFMIKEKIEKESELYAILIPETLDALKAGGRISSAAAALAGALKICPLLQVKDGGIDVYGKVRTLKKAYSTGINAVTKDVDPSQYTWMVIDAYASEQAEQLKSLLEEATGQPVERHTFKAVILSHTGKGTIGFGRIKKISY